jgi:hypothetical protein
MSYIGSTPTTQSFIAGTDYFNGTGSQTAFTLSRSVVSANDIQATVNNVVQQPNDAYTVSGTTITFTSAPSAGTQNVYVRYLSTTTQSITPSQGTVSWSTLNSDLQQDLGISFKNRIINGAMVIDQRNAGASVTGSTAQPYTLDRWQAVSTQNSKYTVQQDAGAITPPVGFNDYLGVTSSSAYSVTSGDVFLIRQSIEGFNIADLGWGTANAKTVTLSFWVRSSLTGTFGGRLGNSAPTRSYPFSYTISTANTWEQKTVTIVGDASGTWLVTNGVGMQVCFSLGAGSTYSGTANTWAGADYTQPTGSVSVVGTSGATFYITGVQLEVGTQATTFDYRDFGRELILCQRYYEKSFDYNTAATSAIAAGGAYGLYTTSGSAGGLTTAYLDGYVGYRVEKRTGPSVGSFDEAGNAGKCTRISPGVLATSNQSWSAGSPGTTGFTTTSISGTSAGRISFYWTASAEL